MSVKVVNTPFACKARNETFYRNSVTRRIVCVPTSPYIINRVVLSICSRKILQPLIRNVNPCGFIHVDNLLTTVRILATDILST